MEEMGLVLQCEELLYFLASDPFGKSTQGVASLLVEAGTFAMGNEGLAVLEEGEVTLQAIESPPLLVVVVMSRCVAQAYRCLSEKDKALESTRDSTL